MSHQKNPKLAVGLLALVLLSATGCNKQAYKRVASIQGQSAPGNFMVPPKVDILLAEDNSGSLYEMFSDVERQMPPLLADLESRGWDYHFATIPLITQRTLEAGIASKHDGNWNPLGLYTPPFPGAPANRPGNLASRFFRTPNDYVNQNHFITPEDIDYSQNGNEPGLATIDNALRSRVNGTGFLRSDALLAVLVVGNGNDTSGVNYCDRGDGYNVRCEDTSNCTLPDGFTGGQHYLSPSRYECRPRTYTSSLKTYRDRLLTLKGSPEKIRFYAAVANQSTTGNQCLGSTAYKGTRYQWMAEQLGGQKIDICNKSIATAFDEMSQHLQAEKLAFRTRYLFTGDEPDLSKPLVITVYRADGRVETLPQGGSNGWTYRGYLTANAIDSPIGMNQTTGYAIELRGTARLYGDDRADIQYTPVGGEDSSG